MKKIQKFVGLLAFVGLAVLNFTQSENSIISKSLASSGSSSSTSSSSSSSNDCCIDNAVYQLLYPCNRKKIVSPTHVNCTVLTTMYYSSSGECRTEIIRYGVIICAVDESFKSSSVSNQSSISGFEFDTETVSCPTSGDCNICEEYRPSCEV